MSFTDVMYGGLGQLNNQFQANLGQNAAMNQGNQAAIQQQQINNAAQQAQLAALYGPQGFGGQTDYYSALGAAYGRGTGGFGGGGNGIPGAYPAGTVTSAPMPGYQLDPTPDVGAGGGYDPYATQNPFGGYAAPTPGSGGYNPFDSSTWANQWPTYPGGGGGGMSFPAAPQAQVDWSPYFNQLTAPQSPYNNNSGGLAPGSGGYNPFDSSTWANQSLSTPNNPDMMRMLGYTPDQYLGGPNYGGAGQFDPNSFANRFAAGGYYNPGTPSQISGYAPNGYDPFSGAQPPYTYQPGMVQGMGGPGDWVRQQIPGMQTLSPNDMSYRQSPFVNLPGS
jgi:hypothetical protein